MAIRVKHTVAVRIAQDTDFKFPMWSPDLTLSEVILDGFDKQANTVIAVPITSTETMPFGDVDVVKGIYLEVNADCKVRLNGSADSIDMRIGASTDPAKLFLEGDINQVDVENESATAVLTGFFVCWGDPTP